MDVVMPVALGFPDRPAAGEDHVCGGDQLILALAQFRGGEAEGRQLVHAVIDDGCRVHMPRDRPHHGRVEPQDRLVDARQRQHLVQQPRQPRLLLLPAPPVGDAGADGLDGGALEGMEFQIGQVVGGRDRLFPHQHAPRPREASHQVLRTLQNEIPAQVRKADKGGMRAMIVGEGRGKNRGDRGSVVHHLSFTGTAAWAGWAAGDPDKPGRL